PSGRRERELRCNRGLDFENSAIRLDDGDIVRRHPEGREAAHQFRRCKHLVAQVVEMGAGERSSHQTAIGRPDLRDAGDMKKLSSDCSFEFMPQFISVAQQGDIGGMFEVSESNDARQAVGGATVVAWRVTLQPQHALASARHMLERRAPHRAQAADHHIEMSHTVGPAIRFFPTLASVVARLLRRRSCHPRSSPRPAFAGTAVPRLFAGIGGAMPIGRHKAAILADIATVKPLRALIILAALCAFAPYAFAAAQVIPLPRPRPPEISPVPSAKEATPEEAPPPSACRLRLTAELAVA